MEKTNEFMSVDQAVEVCEAEMAKVGEVKPDLTPE